MFFFIARFASICEQFCALYTLFLVDVRKAQDGSVRGHQLLVQVQPTVYLREQYSSLYSYKRNNTAMDFRQNQATSSYAIQMNNTRRPTWGIANFVLIGEAILFNISLKMKAL